MKFHKGSKNEVEDEDLFTQAESVVAFIVSPNTLQCAVKQPRHVKASKTAFFFSPPPFGFHPSPLTNALGSVCNRSAEWPFPVAHPLSGGCCQGRAPPCYIMGLNCVWPLWRTMAEGLSFLWPSPRLEGPLYTIFSPAIQKPVNLCVCVHEHNRSICQLLELLFYIK